MSESNDDVDDLILRTRAVEEEIEATRARIEKLLGVGADASLFSRKWKDRFVAEVRHEMPPIELPAAHESLVEAMHRETGLVGAVRRRGDELEWKPFFEHPGTRGLEVHCEGDAERPTLRLRGSTMSPTRQGIYVAGSAVAAGAGTFGAIMLGLPGIVAGGGALVGLLLFMLLAARFFRGGAERQLAALGRRVGEEMVGAVARVRVADPSADADTADAALVFETERADDEAKEARRGVS